MPCKRLCNLQFLVTNCYLSDIYHLDTKTKIIWIYLQTHIIFTQYLQHVQVDALGLSMDIHGEYEGGGVCQECGHFTTGINCEQCMDGYYRPPGVQANDTEPCRRE